MTDSERERIEPEGPTEEREEGSRMAPGARADEGTETTDDVPEPEVETASASDELMAELDELRDRHLRLAAEFDNYRRRTRQELLKTRELGQAELVRRLLEPLDDLRRFAETPVGAESTTLEALREGVGLVERKLLKELREAGLEPIEPLGRSFDPNEHEALSSIPTDDPFEDEKVVEVYLLGYRFGDRLLRPARVAVAAYRPDVREEGDGEEEEARRERLADGD